jgi:phosphopantothenoylcysteine decarboxylase/phosphopantothenate--cysteine ligase
MARPRWLITAGPTHEPIDVVRYLANRSSGRLGVALARAAHAGDIDVTLLLGPGVAAPADIRTIRFSSTADLERLLAEHFPRCGTLIMAAAVADYRPAQPVAGKLPRGTERLQLELEPTPDLVAACARLKGPKQRIIGFALEEPDVLAERARAKLARKGLDAIVANPLSTMGSATIEARIIRPAGPEIRPAGGDPLEKPDFARWLVEWIRNEL